MKVCTLVHDNGQSVCIEFIREDYFDEVLGCVVDRPGMDRYDGLNIRFDGHDVVHDQAQFHVDVDLNDRERVEALITADPFTLDVSAYIEVCEWKKEGHPWFIVTRCCLCNRCEPLTIILTNDWREDPWSSFSWDRALKDIT